MFHICICRANGSLGGKRKHDEDKNRFKPDYVVFLSQRSSRLDLACAEVKPPANTSTYPKSDLVKLGQEMKLMLNKMLKEGVEVPVVGGVLVSGFIMRTYKLELVTAKCYIMTELSDTALFRSLQEVGSIPTIASNLLQLKVKKKGIIYNCL